MLPTFLQFVSIAATLATTAAAPPAGNVITLPETVIVVRSVARETAGTMHCGTPRALLTDSVQTVRTCTVSK